MAEERATLPVKESDRRKQMDLQFIGKMLQGAFWNSHNWILAIPTYLAVFAILLPVFLPRWKGWGEQLIKTRKVQLRTVAIAVFVFLLFVSLILSANGIYQNKTTELRKTIEELQGNITLLQNQLQQTPKTFALPEELLGSHLSGLKIRLTSMTLDYVLLENKIFDDCTFYGPAVIQFQDPVQVNNVVFVLEGGVSIDTIFIKSTNNTFMGVIGFKNCIFNNCSFVHIGYIASPEAIDAIKGRVTFIP